MSDEFVVTVEKRERKSDKARAIGAQMLVDAGVNVFAQNVAVPHALMTSMRDEVAVRCELSKQLALTYVKNNLTQMIRMAQALQEG